MLPKPTSSAQQPIHRRNRSSQTPSTNIIYTLHICMRVSTVHKMLSGSFASKVFQGINSQKFLCFKCPSHLLAQRNRSEKQPFQKCNSARFNLLGSRFEKNNVRIKTYINFLNIKKTARCCEQRETRELSLASLTLTLRIFSLAIIFYIKHQLQFIVALYRL